MIAARGLTIRAGGRDLLRDVTLEVEPGKIVAVIGPNGAGKSTLLRALAGEMAPSSGTVLFEGAPIERLGPLALARRRAVVSQNVELAFPIAAREVVALGRLPWHGTQQAAEDGMAVTRAMAEAGVSRLAARSYSTLSGGEQQRIQLARALAQLDGATAPSGLLLDEPTASLDAAHRVALLRLLRARAAGGAAVLAILHDLNETAFVADRVAILADGRLVSVGPPGDVLEAGAVGAVFGTAFRSVPGGGLLPEFGSQ